jgi:prepilin-type N-terminal cleavage/methylation domain-containing protein
MVRRAFTLVELIVTLAIILILLALLLPAVQYAREAARRARCESNLRQLVLAVHLYQNAHQCLPPAPSWNGYGVHAAVLSFVELEQLAQLLDRDVPASRAASRLRGNFVSIFLFPSDGSALVLNQSGVTRIPLGRSSPV